MAWSARTVVLLSGTPLLLWAVVCPLLWEVYRSEMALLVFSGIANTYYFFATTLYFMFLFLKVWKESLKEAEG